METIYTEADADRAALSGAIAAFDSVAVRQWAEELGIPTFVGTSGRVFPQDMKAAPLLRAWLHRLRGRGVRIHVRHRWTGWTPEGALRFETPAGETAVAADATVLALGGAFHTRRLGVRASQVGTVSPARGARRTTADRLALALQLLRDPAFDALVTGRSDFGELPTVMARLSDGSLPAICHLITYDSTDRRG